MGGIELRDIGTLLGFGSGTDIIWNIGLYIIFFLSLFAMFRMPDKNMVPTLLIGAVLALVVIAKISLNARYIGERPVLTNREFGMFVLNAGMAVFPLIAAGMVRAKKKGPVIGASVLTGIFALVYLLLFGIIEQRWFAG
jgi:threonine/homoserine/homoserine lactone efflux protein